MQAPARQPATKPAAPAHTNRLAGEASPYLLQHAHNPVEWRPWGKEAFDEARRRDIPIFLSVGYSTCYWCHVMERESFESEATAAIMNEHFVSIKVDREERPDVDEIYMAATQAMTGAGGWPMSVFLEPRSLKPFWCGTYFPPDSAYGRPSFPQVLKGIASAWKDQRAEVLRQADELAGAVAERLATKHEPVPVGQEQVAQAVGALLKIHDRVNGGFGDAPKFPQPAYLDLLLRFRPHAADEDTAAGVDAAIRLTLDKMALGGMNDQVGGGFHRYSTDARWQVPHFEKMLYDNAQLAETYARAARAFDDDFYRRTARRTLDYVLREMVSSEGPFFSAQDAEVNHREGQNYLWSPEQVRAVLSNDDAVLAIDVYGLAAGPNFRDPHHPEEPPSNVPFLPDRPGRLAQQRGLAPADFTARLDRINEALYAARRKRDQPGLDDKVLTGWNGLMIGALAVGGSVLGEPRYIQAAARAADFILATCHRPVLGSVIKDEGILFRTWRRTPAGEQPAPRIPAFLEDYAFLIHGLIELHRAAPDAEGKYLAAAVALADDAEARFGDAQSGAYYDTLADQDDLFVRARSEYDGALPSGTSVMLNNLLDLHDITGDASYIRRAAHALASVSAFLASTPVGAVNSTRALLRLLTKDPALLREVLPGQPAPASRQPPGADDPVQILAATDRLEIADSQAAGLVLQLVIAEGYHVNAADPGPGGKDLMGLRVAIIGGGGVTAFAEYPVGKPYRPEWSRAADEILVYRGTVSIPVIVERGGKWTGRPLLAVTYQACTDSACLEPRTVELDVAIDRK